MSCEPLVLLKVVKVARPWGRVGACIRWNLGGFMFSHIYLILTSNFNMFISNFISHKL